MYKVGHAQANFFLVHVDSRYTSGQLSELLLERYDILVKDCDTKTGLKGKNYVRIAIRDTRDNDTLIHALKELGK